MNLIMEEKDQNKSTSKPAIFISGKMRGLKDLGRQRFNQAQAMLEESGFIVMNPACLPIGLPDEKYMPICISMLNACDYVFMLAGWQESQGANIEYSYACNQKKTIIFEHDKSASEEGRP